MYIRGEKNTENKANVYQMKQPVSHEDYCKYAVRCTMEQVSDVGLMPNKPVSFDGRFAMMFVNKPTDNDNEAAQVMVMGAMSNTDLANMLICLVTQLAENFSPVECIALKLAFDDYFESKLDKMQDADYAEMLRNLLNEMRN